MFVGYHYHGVNSTKPWIEGPLVDLVDDPLVDLADDPLVVLVEGLWEGLVERQTDLEFQYPKHESQDPQVILAPG